MHYLLTGAPLLLLLMGQVARVAAACRGSFASAASSRLSDEFIPSSFSTTSTHPPKRLVVWIFEKTVGSRRNKANEMLASESGTGLGFYLNLGNPTMLRYPGRSKTSNERH
jgi:hypothetical protein